MKKELSWQRYVLKDDGFTGFAPHMRVLDVGCGHGGLLRELTKTGRLAIGIDPDRQSLENCRRRGLTILQARGEHIPLKDASLDGLTCRGVLMYTDETMALREIRRVLTEGAVARLSYHGSGYYLRHFCFYPSWKSRFYGVRTLINTWLYATTGRRLPAFLGDTIYQSRRRLARYYRQNGLRLLDETLAKTFLGLPVFIYHTIQKMTN